MSNIKLAVRTTLKPVKMYQGYVIVKNERDDKVLFMEFTKINRLDRLDAEYDAQRLSAELGL
jgi:hypothetical protein